jgi:hypothetical protein
MVTSDDEYGFDDLVLDERTLAVLDATERDLAAAIPSTSHPRSPTEQPPTKRLKTTDGWIPLQGQQPHKRTSPSRGLTKSRFSLEDTDLPEITISNGFYSGPGRFFVGSQQSEPSASPKVAPNSRGSAVGADSDVILLSTPTQQDPPPGGAFGATSNHTSRRLPPAQPGLASQANRERTIPTSVLFGVRKASIRHPSPALPVTNASRPSTLTRSSSFSDAMRAALRSALSEVDSPALLRSSSITSSRSPSPLSAAAPRASFQETIPNTTQATAHSRLERLSHLQRREQSLPPQHLRPHRQPSQHGAASRPQPSRVSQVATQRQHTPVVDQTILPIGDLPAVQDELESLRVQVEEARSEPTRLFFSR